MNSEAGDMAETPQPGERAREQNEWIGLDSEAGKLEYDDMGLEDSSETSGDGKVPEDRTAKNPVPRERTYAEGEHLDNGYDNLISNLIAEVQLFTAQDPNKLPLLQELSSALYSRFEDFDSFDDLEDSIKYSQEAIDVLPSVHPDQPYLRCNLGASQMARFGISGSIAHLENAVLTFQNVVQLTDDEHPARAMHLANLGVSLMNRFDMLGEFADIEASLGHIQRAVELTDDENPDKVDYLRNLCHAFTFRFERLGETSDSDACIHALQQAAVLVDDEHPDKVMHLTNLGDMYLRRFTRVGELEDVEASISHFQRAVELTNDDHSARTMLLANLGSSLKCRFEAIGELADLTASISYLKRAVSLAGTEHRSLEIYMGNLGSSFRCRFESLDNLADLDSSISHLQRAVELAGDENPAKFIWTYNLGVSLSDRFQRRGEFADLEAAISCFQRAVEHNNEDPRVKALYTSRLGGSLRSRFEELGDFADLQASIFHLQGVVELTDDEHPSKAKRLESLALSLQCRFERLGDVADIETSVSHLQRAIELAAEEDPNRLEYIGNLGVSIMRRFERLNELADIEASISHLQQANELSNDNHPIRGKYMGNLGGALVCRFERLGEIADIEASIFYFKRAVKLTVGRSIKALWMGNLGVSLLNRFERLGQLADIEESVSYLEQAVDITDDSSPNKAMYLGNLGASLMRRFEKLGRLADINESISRGREAVRLTNNESPDKATWVGNLGISLMVRFEKLGEAVDVEASTAHLQQAVGLLANDHPSQAMYLGRLGDSHLLGFKTGGIEKDLELALASYKAAAEVRTAYPNHILRASRSWGDTAYQHGKLASALQGYRIAAEILPQVAWIGLTQPSRQQLLSGEDSEGIACTSAACAIESGDLEAAVELLDSGRSYYWRQASAFRKELESVKAVNPDLAGTLASVGRQLEMGTSVSTLYSTSHHEVVQRSLDNIGSHRRELARSWDATLSQIRCIPSLENFLRPAPFHSLRGVLSAGHIIIINVSNSRVDALIVDAIKPILHVPLPHVDLDYIVRLSETLSGQIRGHPAGSVSERKVEREHINRDMKYVLREIWTNIVVPIFQALHIPTTIDEGPTWRRVWWYLTGPLTAVPIHAAGLHEDEDSVDVSQLVISSYINTLASLIDAQEKMRHSPSSSNLLAISQHMTTGENPLPYTLEEIAKVVECFKSAAWAEDAIFRLEDSEATVEHVSDALESCSWVHFACHGVQDEDDAMKSSFLLHDGRLRMSEITTKRLKMGRFAFLSCCHGAAGIAQVPGEAMHLAAAMHFAGFPSVVSTLWALRDEDGPIVAEETYRYLFRDGRKVLDVRETAAALNKAVGVLRRRKKASLDQWAAFVHIGI